MSADDILFGSDEASLRGLREARLQNSLDRVFAAHPFYRRQFAQMGLKRDDVPDLASLSRLPITTKADFMADPAGFLLGVDGAAEAGEHVVWDTMYTTGSTAAPTPFVSTSYDFLNILALNINMMRLRGVSPQDSILNLFPLTQHPHGAFARAQHAAAAFGIPVTSALPGHASARRPEIGRRLDEVVALAERVRPTILWGVPSYLRTLLTRAEALGARLEAVRLVFVTGEGFGEASRIALIDSLRGLGAPDPRISVSYGATEMQGGMVECTAGAGYHNPAPDQFLFEAVDPETHVPVADGEAGLLLLTHLDRRGTMMLRYSLGDVARLTRARCPHCGALTERLLTVPFRVDGLVKIKGMLVNPLVLVDAVTGQAGIADFQAVVHREVPDDPLSADILMIRVVPAGDPVGLGEAVVARVRAAIGVTPRVALVDASDAVLAARGWKAKPLIDLRVTRLQEG